MRALRNDRSTEDCRSAGAGPGACESAQRDSLSEGRGITTANRDRPPLRIREAILADAPALAKLVTLWGYPADSAVVASRLRHVRGHSNVVLVAATQSQVVGWVHVGLYPTLATDCAAELFGLVVDTEWQAQGIGRRLMRAAEAWALQRGCRSMYVRSNVLRREAHAFYAHLGYHQIKTSLTFERRLSDAGRRPEPSHR